MRRSARLFRWGITCLLVAPLLFLAAVVSGGSALFAWAGFAFIVLGGALNVVGVARGVRGLGSGELMASLDGVDLDEQRRQSAEQFTPRQRIIWPPDEPAAVDSRVRRRIALGNAAALAGLTAFGAWTLAVEQPLAIAAGQALTLTEIYGVWNPASRWTFTVGLALWVLLSGAVVTAVALLGVVRSPAADRLLTARRQLALACIAGGVIVSAAVMPYFSIGISLPDDLPMPAGGVQSPGSLAFGLGGIALCITAIVLTVPDWRRRTR